MKISLRRFLTFGVIIIGLCAGLTAITLAYSTHIASNAVAKLAESVESAASAERIQQNLALHRRQALLKNLRTNDDRFSQTQTAKAQLLKESIELSKYSSSPEEEAIIQRVKQSISAYLENYDSLRIKGIRSNELYESVSEQYYMTQEAIQDLMIFNLNEARNLQAVNTLQNKMNNASVTISLVLLTLAVLFLFLGLGKFLYKPVIKLSKAIENFELGENPPVAPFSGALEIQTIASSFSNLSSKLSKQKEMQLTFLSSIAHDLKNPLGAIKMSADILADDTTLTEQSHSMLSIISRQSEHLLRLIGDLLDTTRVESGHLELHFSERDIRPLIQDAVKLHSNLSSKHRFEMLLSNQPIIVNCDEQRLTQVFNNLFNNAIKYSPGGGTIKIMATTNGQFAEIKIADSGVGIISADLDGIFEPFRRSSTTRSTIPGIGLGLSSSRKIIRSHPDGDILVSSLDGKGTTFIVKLRVSTI